MNKNLEWVREPSINTFSHEDQLLHKVVGSSTYMKQGYATGHLLSVIGVVVMYKRPRRRDLFHLRSWCRLDWAISLVGRTTANNSAADLELVDAFIRCHMSVPMYRDQGVAGALPRCNCVGISHRLCRKLLHYYQTNFWSYFLRGCYNGFLA